MKAGKKRGRGKWIVIALLTVAVGGGVAFRFLRKPNDVINVQVEKVTRRDITETVVASGKIQPVVQVMISPEVAGEIVELPVKEGQPVKRGDLLLQIKPDNYMAGRNSAEASYKSTLGSRSQAEAELRKAEADFTRNQELFTNTLISTDVYMSFKTAHEVARLRFENSLHQADQARFALDKAEDDLKKTTIVAPIDGTVTKLKSQLGERVLGTSFNMGTEMMTIARLDEMEARVDIGEIDIVLIEVGQNVALEVDAFKDKKFTGTVSEIANASKGPAQGGGGGQQQEAPKFEVKIRVNDKEAFRPGMSVTAQIETRSRKGVLAVPILAVTTRLPTGSFTPAQTDKPAVPPPESSSSEQRKGPEVIKTMEVVFALDGEKAKMIAVKTGISDSDYYEVESGLTEGQQIIVGSYNAISKELEDGKKVQIGTEPVVAVKEKK